MKIAVPMLTEIIKMLQKHMDPEMCFNHHRYKFPVSPYSMILHFSFLSQQIYSFVLGLEWSFFVSNIIGNYKNINQTSFPLLGDKNLTN